MPVLFCYAYMPKQMYTLCPGYLEHILLIYLLEISYRIMPQIFHCEVSYQRRWRALCTCGRQMEYRNTK